MIIYAEIIGCFIVLTVSRSELCSRHFCHLCQSSNQGNYSNWKRSFHSTKRPCWRSGSGTLQHQPISAATYRCGTVHRTFTHLVLHCWHNLPGERTLQHEASVTRHLLSGTHFLGHYFTVPLW